VKQPLNVHPNATVAGTSAGAGVLVVWLFGHFGVKLSAEDGAVVAGVASTVALLIGRNGLAGLWKTLLHGKSTT
jgi:hypothetical protein